jgi:prevent-host-death family protein
MKHRIVSATDFKARCLALLDEVAEEGGSITVTKRGRPVATVGPVKKQPWKSPKGVLASKVKIVGDIVNTDMADLWDVVSRK